MIHLTAFLQVQDGELARRRGLMISRPVSGFFCLSDDASELRQAYSDTANRST